MVGKKEEGREGQLGGPITSPEPWLWPRDALLLCHLPRQSTTARDSPLQQPPYKTSEELAYLAKIFPGRSWWLGVADKGGLLGGLKGRKQERCLGAAMKEEIVCGEEYRGKWNAPCKSFQVTCLSLCNPNRAPGQSLRDRHGGSAGRMKSRELAGRAFSMGLPQLPASASSWSHQKMEVPF